MNDAEKLSRIISGGYCIGCGVCAALESDHINMAFDQYGMIQPQFNGEMDAAQAERILKVCPFSDDEPNEDDLAGSLFPDCEQDVRIGRHKGLYAGYVAEGEYRARGSSGGVISWVLAELLKKNLADKVIHVAPVPASSGRLFAYRVSTSVEEVLQGAKSKYYPIELSEVLARVRAETGRYVLVGVPCFIKAVRRLALIDPVIQERIIFYVGLVCGHLKSKAFADCFAWQAGIQPGQLEKIDFRVKLPNRNASDYGVMLTGNGKSIMRATREFFGSNWGHGFFKYSACEYCDDVFAETADLSVGDAWLPEYTEDSSGNSIVVTRSVELDQLVRAGMASGRLSMKDCPSDAMAESQAGGLRHRRDGLSYRLYLKEEEGVWAPKKRVPVSEAGVGSKRKRIYGLRETLRQRSHELWAESVSAGSFALFESEMKKLIRRYNRAYASFPARIAQKAKMAIKKVLGL
jgi:coenzyme F420-reducing hydrogenase beta subunit